MTTLIPNARFYSILGACSKAIPNLDKKPLLAVDPGETTGFARWDGKAVHLDQWDTKDRPATFRSLRTLCDHHGFWHLRCEDYRVYSFKADQHHFTELHTAKLIGAIECAAVECGVPMSMMMAQQAKMFWTDDKLKACTLYEPGMKHARDALRHLLYLMCFGTKGD